MDLEVCHMALGKRGSLGAKNRREKLQRQRNGFSTKPSARTDEGGIGDCVADWVSREKERKDQSLGSERSINWS